MVCLQVKSGSYAEMLALQEQVHKALIGSPAYIKSEIALSNCEDNTSFLLVIGESNNFDVKYSCEFQHE